MTLDDNTAGASAQEPEPNAITSGDSDSVSAPPLAHLDPRNILSVFIVESPSEHDLDLDRYEAAALARTLRLTGITCRTNLAISAGAFGYAILHGIAEMLEGEQKIPILHISAHG